MARLLVALALLVAIGANLSAAPVPPPPSETLPEGATARLGSLAFRGHNMNGLTFSPNGKTLRAAANWHLLVWDAETGKLLPWKKFAPKDLQDLRGNSAVVGNRHIWLGAPPSNRIDEDSELAVVISDFETNETRRFTFPGQAFLPYHELTSPTWHSRASVSSDGKYMAVWHAKEKSIHVYDLDTAKRVHTEKIEANYPFISISADGKTVFFEGKMLQRCELLTGKLLPELRSAQRIETTTDGKRAIIRDGYNTYDPDFYTNKLREPKDPDHRTLFLWDLAANKSLGKLTLSGLPIHFKCSGSKTMFVIAGEHRTNLAPRFTLSRWNLDTQKKEWETLCPHVDWLAVSPDGKRLAITDRWHIAHLYNAETGKRESTPAAHSGPITWIGYSADGNTITTADRYEVRTWRHTGEAKNAVNLPEETHGPGRFTILGDQLVWVVHDDNPKIKELVGWDLTKNAIAWRMPFEEPVPDRIYSHDGKRVVGLTWDNKKRLWNTAVYDGLKGKKLHTWSMTEEQSGPAAFYDEGRSLYVGSIGINRCDVTTGKTTKQVDVVGAGWIDGSPNLHGPFSLTTTPDGGRVAFLRRSSKVNQFNTYDLVVYDTKSGKQLAGHEIKNEPPVNTWYGVFAKLSPNGKQVVMWFGQGTKVLVCDVESDAKPRVLDASMSRPICAAFSPNSTSLAVGYEDGTALIWDLIAK